MCLLTWMKNTRNYWMSFNMMIDSLTVGLGLPAFIMIAGIFIQCTFRSCK